MSAQNKAIRIDVSLMQLYLIFALVTYHAFAPFCGGWQTIPDYPAVDAYWWIGKAIYSFMLESFVFISGLLFGIQTLRKPNIIAKGTIWKKAKRLLLPSIVFSGLYFLIFDNTQQLNAAITYRIVNGIGHMWFLPMLWWCFVFTVLIEKSSLKATHVLPVLLLAASCSFVTLPFQLGSCLYYLFFFYLGFSVGKFEHLLSRFKTNRNAILLVSIFIISFVVLTVLRHDIISSFMDGSLSTVMKLLLHLCDKLAVLFYATIGLSMLYIISNILIDSKIIVSLRGGAVGSYCFGIYLFQQFILQTLYYKTDLPQLVSWQMLPWIGLCLTLFFSTILSFAFMHTKFGRFLIG